MNHKNYCTLEYAQKLVDAGIVLKTDAAWKWLSRDKIYLLCHKDTIVNHDYIPAPQFQDVWDELPDLLTINKRIFARTMSTIDGIHYISYHSGNDWISTQKSDNPTNAAIDLLLWVKENKK